MIRLLYEIMVGDFFHDFFSFVEFQQFSSMDIHKKVYANYS
jgi:hypothetical protein